MSEREDCGTPCNRWQFRLYSCEGCLFRLRDTQYAPRTIDTVFSSSTVIPLSRRVFLSNGTYIDILPP
jgi:hypothetical protein